MTSSVVQSSGSACCPESLTYGEEVGVRGREGSWVGVGAGAGEGLLQTLQKMRRVRDSREKSPPW